MAVTLISRTSRAGGFMVSEANGLRSRQQITMVSGQASLLAGSVLGRITASGKYCQYNPANSDGSEAVAAVLWDDCDATLADTQCVGVVRDAEVNQGELLWFTGASGGQITAGIAGLTAIEIIARPSVPA